MDMGDPEDGGGVLMLRDDVGEVQVMKSPTFCCHVPNYHSACQGRSGRD